MGFIGSHWVKRLVAEGYKVTGIDIKPLENSFKNLKNFSYIKVSVFNYKTVEKFIKNDIICHLLE